MENNKKSNVTILTVILLIITIISILAVIMMHEVVRNTKEESGKIANQIIKANVNDEKIIEEEKVKEFIDRIYFIGLDLIPSFNDINSVDEEWIWLCAHSNLFSDGKDPGMYVTKEQVEESAKEVFGEDLEKQFPNDGLEFWLEPEDGKYFVGRAGLDPDYINDYEVVDIIAEQDKIIVEVVEYKYNSLHDDTTLQIINIENNQVIDNIKEEDYEDTDPELFDSSRLYETVSDLVINNLEQFSTAKLTLKMDEQTGILYIVSVDRMK